MAVLPIGFFAPLPLAIMIPFMAAQSFAMGHAFGTSFQYGKRKISSMTNEEFNALSATDLHGELQADIRAMIPDMNESFKRMEDFQIEILISMVNVIKKAGEQFLGLLTGQGASTTQSSTSAIDFSDTGIFNVQGGSRLDLNQKNDRFLNDQGQTYEEWLQSNKVPATIAKLNTAAQRRSDILTQDINRSRTLGAKQAPIQQISNAPAFTAPKEIVSFRAQEKQKIIQNISSLQASVGLKQLELNRFVKAGKARTVGKTRQEITRSNTATVLAFNRGTKILQNQLLDIKKKLQNAQTILRNYR